MAARTRILLVSGSLRRASTNTAALRALQQLCPEYAGALPGYTGAEIIEDDACALRWRASRSGAMG